VTGNKTAKLSSNIDSSVLTSLSMSFPSTVSVTSGVTWNVQFNFNTAATTHRDITVSSGFKTHDVT